MSALERLRAGLDRLYLAGGMLAALFLVAILVLIVLQMLARWTGEVFPGAPEYAGYSMAAASFLAFAYALNSGSHIRVSLLLNAAGPRLRRALDIWCFGIGTALVWYFVYYAIKGVRVSWRFKDVSQGQDATPLWIPQLVMVAGSVLLAVALTDNLINVLFGKGHRIKPNAIDQGHGE